MGSFKPFLGFYCVILWVGGERPLKTLYFLFFATSNSAEGLFKAFLVKMA